MFRLMCTIITWMHNSMPLILHIRSFTLVALSRYAAHIMRFPSGSLSLQYGVNSTYSRTLYGITSSAFQFTLTLLARYTVQCVVLCTEQTVWNWAAVKLSVMPSTVKHDALICSNVLKPQNIIVLLYHNNTSPHYALWIMHAQTVIKWITSNKIKFHRRHHLSTPYPTHKQNERIQIIWYKYLLNSRNDKYFFLKKRAKLVTLCLHMP
jgi:hypothetical protein